MNKMLEDWRNTHGEAFLDAEIYESKAIELQEGDVVTVQPTDGAEFDATVVAVGRNDVVELRVDAREGTVFCDRSLLRKHQLKIVYVVHSDNAAQHFHSVKAMYWLSHLPSTFGWIDRVYWAFGCPGHGKGPWDGIGALIKTMLRHSITTGHDIEADGVRIMTPEDCATHMRGQLGEEWAKDQRRKRAVISRRCSMRTIGTSRGVRMPSTQRFTATPRDAGPCARAPVPSECARTGAFAGLVF